MDWLNSRLNLVEERIRNYLEGNIEREGDGKYEREIKWLEVRMKKLNINLIGVLE